MPNSPSTSERNSAQPQLEDESDFLEPERQQEIRNLVTKLAFSNDPRRYDEFVRTLSDGIPDGVEVILRGSAVTGRTFKTNEPFDHDGPGTSDLDVTFVGGGTITLFREFHIPEIHSVPLSEAHPFASPALGSLRKQLCALTRRPVNLQATTSLVQFVRDVVMDQPYLVLLKKPEEAGEGKSPPADD